MKRLEEGKARVKKLLEASTGAWSRSQRIREYLTAEKARADQEAGAHQSWLTWAWVYAAGWSP